LIPPNADCVSTYSFLDLACRTLPIEAEFLSSTIPMPITLFLGEESYQS
jgi:hypothetical protein